MSQESQAISHNISLLLTAGRTAEARAELDRLLALDPEDPEARSLAGDVYAYTGAHSAAYKSYNLAAETYNRLGRADLALAVHHKILELDLGMLMAKRAAVLATTLRGRPAAEKAAIVAAVREHVWPLVNSGALRVVVDRRVPMPQAADAHRAVEASDHVGKVVLVAQ